MGQLVVMGGDRKTIEDILIGVENFWGKVSVLLVCYNNFRIREQLELKAVCHLCGSICPTSS